MSELFILDRKLDRVSETLGAKVDLLLTKVDQLAHAGKPGLSQIEFARLIKVSPRTVCRWVRRRKLRLERGRVPHSEVRKFLS